MQKEHEYELIIIVANKKNKISNGGTDLTLKYINYIVSEMK